MIILDRISRLLFLGLVASLPFELRFTVFGLSNLQWIFVATAATSLPGLLGDWKELARDRIVIAAGVLMLVYWLAAVTAPEFSGNSINGAVRMTAGLALLMIALRRTDTPRVLGVWCVASIAAATYALGAHLGIVSSNLFRTEEFFLGTAQRLSGSFEYPNTAAAFFAMSLPLVWLIPGRMSGRLAGTALLWLTLVLTYSRGAMAAVLLAYAGVWLLTGAHRRWSPPAVFAAIGAGVFGLVSLAAPLLVTRLSSVTSNNPISALYELDYTGLRQRPNTRDQANVTVINDGRTVWPATGPGRVVLTNRWYHVAEDRLLEDPPIETPIPTAVAPGERMTLEADLLTPDSAGEYLLIWDLQIGQDWFSRLRIDPTFTEVEIAADAVRTTDQRDLSHWYPAEPEVTRSLDASISRRTLWTTAGRMFLENPILGVGPDNFRLLYGRYLGYLNWDTNIRSNSMYLELLATSGLAGLVTFLLVAGFIRWEHTAISIALGVFLVHGLVDVFFMTTPIYFAFWILAGLSRASGARG